MMKYSSKGGNMYKIIVIVFILAAVLIAGCAQVNITGSGNVVNQEEMLSGFDAIDISHSFSVDITQGESYSVVIRIDDNLVEYLDIAKAGSTLMIRFDPTRSYNFFDATMEAEITMPELVGLDLSGNSEARLSGFESARPFTADLSGNSNLRGDIQAGDLRLDASGNSEVTLSGSGGEISVDASGSSKVDLAGFLGVNGDVGASGASTVKVNLSGRLDADASGSSDIYYQGNPELGNIDTSGTSSVQSR
jgi:hypothetical protein